MWVKDIGIWTLAALFGLAGGFVGSAMNKPADGLPGQQGIQGVPGQQAQKNYGERGCNNWVQVAIPDQFNDISNYYYVCRSVNP